MLIGLKNNTVITGAFAGAGDGACPMMAAHLEGGRTKSCSFPEAWDRFTGVYGRQIVRPATEYEVQILCEEIEASLVPLPNQLGDAIAEYQASIEARQRAEAAAAVQQETPAQTRRRRLRITGGLQVDLTEAIEEHKSAARSRRSREADGLGLEWLFEETLVLPEDFGLMTAGEPAVDGEFDFDAAEAELSRH